MKACVLLSLVLVCGTASGLARRLAGSREPKERQRWERMLETELEGDQRRKMDDQFRLRDLVEKFGKTAGRRQVEPCTQTDVVFLVDSSGSVGAHNWHYVLKFVSDVTDKINIGPSASKVGLLTFGDSAHVIFQMSKYSYIHDMKPSIGNAPYLDQNTNTSGGIYVAMHQMFTPQNGDRPNVPNLVVIITDGSSNYDFDKTVPYANEAKNKGITIICVGVGSRANKVELEGMASTGRDGQKLVYYAEAYDLVHEVKDKVALQICNFRGASSF